MPRNKSRFVLAFIMMLVISEIGVIAFLRYKKSPTQEIRHKKEALINLGGSSDLSIATSHFATRHPSKSTLGDIYPSDPVLRETHKESFGIDLAPFGAKGE